MFSGTSPFVVVSVPKRRPPRGKISVSASPVSRPLCPSDVFRPPFPPSLPTPLYPVYKNLTLYPH